LNKQQLIENISNSADISKVAATKALEAFTSAIQSAMEKNDTVSLIGFGTFSVKSRAERNGRNPKTGETIKIQASKSVGFKAGKNLKDAIN
jgi:DNA-binding protein HU-beta